MSNMPSVRYFNQSAPFWDFVASLEEQGTNHPYASAYAGPSRQPDGEGEAGSSDLPWGWGRGRRGPPNHHPPPPEGPEGPSPPPPFDHEGPPPPPESGDHPPPPPPEGEEPHDGPGRHGHGPHHRGRGHCGPRGGHRGGFGGRRGGWGGPSAWGMGGPWNHLGNLHDFFQSQIFGENREGAASNNEDFTPPVDVFDTESAFVVHVSLAGAKKEDIAVNWDVEKSELSITGVIHRPGDEDFLKTLALDERKVGAFERKVRLGSLAHPAKVDDEAITAKMEDGVLRIEVPKEDKDYVDVKKVDIE